MSWQHEVLVMWEKTFCTVFPSTWLMRGQLLFHSHHPQCLFFNIYLLRCLFDVDFTENSTPSNLLAALIHPNILLVTLNKFALTSSLSPLFAFVSAPGKIPGTGIALTEGPRPSRQCEPESDETHCKFIFSNHFYTLEWIWSSSWLMCSVKGDT